MKTEQFEGRLTDPGLKCSGIKGVDILIVTDWQGCQI